MVFRVPVRLREAIRRSVLVGQLPRGTRLPSSRALAQELGVSRNTVVDAYDQLVAEGYLEPKRGSGIYVANLIAPASRRSAKGTTPAIASRRGRLLAAISASRSDGLRRPFSPGIPALTPSLFAGWFQTLARAGRHATSDLLSYGDPSGYGPLREIVAQHLAPSRGVVCTPDHVLITAGIQQAIGLTAALVLDPGQAAWMEDPGYPGASAALASIGADVVAVPVDADGLNVDVGIARSPQARLAYVSPSHQYPLGVTMTLARRLELLQWARRADAWILEDDYDSEFRYDGRSLPAMQGLDPSRVIYLGTFSKTLFPALHLGYAIVPPSLVAAFANALQIAGPGPSPILQAALHQFIDRGSYARHLRRVRAIYAERHAAFCESAHRLLRSRLTISGAAMGLHVAATLTTRRDDVRLSMSAKAHGLSLPPLSTYFAGRDTMPGFVMGYGHVSTSEIRAAMRTLRAMLR